MLHTAKQWVSETGKRSKSALGGNLAGESNLLAGGSWPGTSTTVQDLQ